MADEPPREPDARIEELLRRIERIERAMGLEPPPEARPVAPPTTPVPSFPREAEASGQESGDRASTKRLALEAWRASNAGAVAPPTQAFVPPSQSAGAGLGAKIGGAFRGEGMSLEQLIGGRWFGIVGAVAILLGVGLFLKWAYDEGWIGPTAQCLIVAGFGALLLGAGEFVRRRVGRVASIGPSAAGLGALFFATFASREIYDLLPLPGAMGLMVATTVFGLALAGVVRLASLAGVAMIGGYLAPLVLSSGRPSEVFMPSYLVGLLAVGAGLSGWFSALPEARQFRTLRTLGWWGTVLLGTLWLDDTGFDVPWNGLLFVASVWVVVHAELMLASYAPLRVRPELAVGEAESGALGVWRARWIVGSFTTTAWVALFGVLLMVEHDPSLDWVATAALAAMCGSAAGLAITLDPLPGVLRRGARNPREQLGAGLLAQVGALVIASIAMALGDWVQVVAWLALGAAAVGAGRWIRSGAMYVYGLIVLSIAAARLMTLDLIGAFDSAVAWTPGGLALTTWSAQVGLAALAWICASALLVGSGRRSWIRVGRGAVFIGAALLALVPLHRETDAGSVTVWWLVIGLAATALHRLDRRQALDWLGLAAASAAAVPWMIAYLGPGWSSFDAALLLHPGLMLGVLVVGAQIGLGALMKRGEPVGCERWAWGTLGQAVGVVLLFLATSLEAGRVAATLFAHDDTSRAAVLSIWWGVYAVGLLALGFARRSAPVRYAGLGLIGVAAAKAVLFDLAQVSEGWRVVSFIGLGLLMIGVAVVYARVATLLRAGGVPVDAGDEGGAGTVV